MESIFSAHHLDEDAVVLAKHLLYEIYANQMVWLPEEQNPSQWKVYRDESGYYFDDMFNQSARWFGVFNDGQLVGCARVIEAVENKLELEHYTKLDSRFKENMKIVEMNRLAIDKNFNGTIALSLLLKVAIQDTLKHSVDYIISGFPKATVKLGLLLGFQKCGEFSYSDDSENGISLMYLDCKNGELMDSSLQMLESNSLSLNFF